MIKNPIDNFTSELARLLRKRDEEHIKAELQRLGISEVEAPQKVVIVHNPSLLRMRPNELPPLPEVLTVEEWAERLKV